MTGVVGVHVADTGAAAGSDAGLEPRLHAILAGVNDWLKFAEAKNVALVALDGAGLAALLGTAKDLAASKATLPDYAGWYLSSLAVFLGLSLVVALTSLAPVVAVPWDAPRRAVSGGDNLLYWGDLAGRDPDCLLAQIAAATGHPESGFTRLERNYAHQIAVNAGIAARKYRAFHLAVLLTLVGVLTPVLALFWGVATVAVRNRR